MKFTSENKCATNFLRILKNVFTPNVRKMNLKPWECLLNQMEVRRVKEKGRIRYDLSQYNMLKFCIGEICRYKKCIAIRWQDWGFGSP